MDVKITSVIEKIVAIVAPHRCVVCGSEDNMLCTECAKIHIQAPDSFCVLCGKATKGWRVCARHHAPLASTTVAAIYQGVVADLIHKYKFERSRAAFEPLARLLAAQIQGLNAYIVPIPTATNHVRQRGYDHALLLAKAVAAYTNLPVTPLLRRQHDTQQVGASRRERQQQAVQAFYVAGAMPNKPLLLIDDVCTTGSTLVAAAEVLTHAGAHSVQAAVCAWRSPNAQV